MGLFIERWLDRGALKIIAETSKKGDILRLMKDDDKWEELVRNVAMNTVIDHLEKSNVVPSQEELMKELGRVTDDLMSQQSMFIKSVQDIIASGVESKVHITNEDLDTSVTIANLFTLMKIPPEQRDDDMVKQIYDLMGLQIPRKTEQEKMQEAQQAQALQMQGQPQGQQAPAQMQRPALPTR